eukprot:GILJ01028242.1.p1 GENE.GILJ01028242.1~~GILJ01028242.1.p1  ORF type:complete len:426 (+),score=37.25 GILJ01028242.1:509-1786(+)
MAVQRLLSPYNVLVQVIVFWLSHDLKMKMRHRSANNNVSTSAQLKDEQDVLVRGLVRGCPAQGDERYWCCPRTDDKLDRTTPSFPDPRHSSLGVVIHSDQVQQIIRKSIPPSFEWPPRQEHRPPVQRVHPSPSPSAPLTARAVTPTQKRPVGRRPQSAQPRLVADRAVPPQEGARPPTPSLRPMSARSAMSAPASSARLTHTASQRDGLQPRRVNAPVRNSSRMVRTFLRCYRQATSGTSDRGDVTKQSSMPVVNTVLNCQLSPSALTSYRFQSELRRKRLSNMKTESPELLLYPYDEDTISGSFHLKDSVLKSRALLKPAVHTGSGDFKQPVHLLRNSTLSLYVSPLATNRNESKSVASMLLEMNGLSGQHPPHTTNTIEQHARHNTDRFFDMPPCPPKTSADFAECYFPARRVRIKPSGLSLS